MKYTTLLVLILFFSFGAAYAQKIHFTDKTNRWVYSFSGGDLCDGVVFVSFGIDTFMFGHTYQTIVTTSEPIIPTGGGCTLGGYQGYRLSVREDTVAGIVYSRNLHTDTTERVFFNYHWRVGDTVSRSRSSFPLDTIGRIDSVLVGGMYYKEFFLRSTDPNVNLQNSNITVVEGLGSPSWILVPMYGFYFEYQECLLCFSNNGSNPPFYASYRGSTYPCRDTFINTLGCASYLTTPPLKTPIHAVSIVPNPTSDECTFNCNDMISELTITNMTGSSLVHLLPNRNSVTLSLANFPPGIYIANIRYGTLGANRQISKVIKE